MRWVTWEQVGVDRIGCAWLIRRWIDQDAEFIFIPYGSHDLPEGAEPFDIPGARFSHRGPHASFHTMLTEHDLNDSVLQRIARIVDEADVVQEVSLEPVAFGLDTICRGIRATSAGDQEALERGAMVYDALYAELAQERT